MSSLSAFVKVVWCVQIVKEDNTPVTDWQEFESEEFATQEAIAQVQYYVAETAIHHEGIIQKRVIPLYV